MLWSSYNMLAFSYIDFFSLSYLGIWQIFSYTADFQWFVKLNFSYVRNVTGRAVTVWVYRKGNSNKLIYYNWLDSCTATCNYRNITPAVKSCVFISAVNWSGNDKRIASNLSTLQSYAMVWVLKLYNSLFRMLY